MSTEKIRVLNNLYHRQTQLSPQRHLLGSAVGAPWRDLSDVYGHRTTCYNRSFDELYGLTMAQKALGARRYTWRLACAGLPSTVWAMQAARSTVRRASTRPAPHSQFNHFGLVVPS